MLANSKNSINIYSINIYYSCYFMWRLKKVSTEELLTEQFVFPLHLGVRNEETCAWIKAPPLTTSPCLTELNICWRQAPLQASSTIPRVFYSSGTSPLFQSCLLLCKLTSTCPIYKVIWSSNEAIYMKALWRFCEAPSLEWNFLVKI